MAAEFSQTTNSLVRDAPRSAHVAWIFAGLFLGCWLLWLFFATVTVYEISRRARLEVRSASHHVAALVPGKIASTSLVIGRTVEVGDVLIELDATSEKLRLKEEETRLEAIPARIASLQREIEVRERARADDLQSAAAAAEVSKQRIKAADVAVEFAQHTEQRIGILNAGGLASRVDAARTATETLKLTAARDALVSELQRIEWEAQSRAHQHDAEIENLRRFVVTLEGEMATTRATIERLRTEIEKHLVRAPISGRIGDMVPTHAGAYVAEGQRLATVVPAGDLIIVADFIPSLAVGRIRPGQKAELRLDAFPWAQFGSIPATVSRVASEIRDNLVRVEFTPDAAPVNAIVMQHGLLGSIEVSVEQAPPASLMLRAAGLLLSNPARANTTGELAR